MKRAPGINCQIVSLDKVLYSMLCPSTQVYKWVPVTIKETLHNINWG